MSTLVYGWRSLSLTDAIRRLGVVLGVSFALHESLYRGTYYRAVGHGIEEVIVQHNLTQDGLAEERFADHMVIVYIESVSESIKHALSDIPGLELLDEE